MRGGGPLHLSRLALFAQQISLPLAAGGWSRAALYRLALIVGLAAIVLPTIVTLAQEHWSTDNGAHGPIILASGIWLIWRERERIAFKPGSISLPWLLLLLPMFLAFYLYGRSFGVLVVESGALYAILVLLGLFYWGPAVMRRLRFPVLYLAFLIRPPSGIVTELTQPLKIWLSQAAVEILYLFGYPVGRTGVLIQIGQYELMVQQACAGLGSIVSLLAIGMLYVHLTNRGGGRRSIVLVLGIIPIAVLANLLRVLLLILLTYYAGDQVAQSFAHETAGLVTFGLSVLGMLALDYALGSWRKGSRDER